MNEAWRGAVEGDEMDWGLCWMGGLWPACRQWLRPKKQTNPNQSINSSSTKQKRESAVDFFSSLNWLSNGIGAANEMNQSMEKKESNKRQTKRSAASSTTLSFFCRPAEAPSKRKKWVDGVVFSFFFSSSLWSKRQPTSPFQSIELIVEWNGEVEFASSL